MEEEVKPAGLTHSTGRTGGRVRGETYWGGGCFDSKEVFSVGGIGSWLEELRFHYKWFCYEKDFTYGGWDCGCGGSVGDGADELYQCRRGLVGRPSDGLGYFQ